MSVTKDIKMKMLLTVMVLVMFISSLSFGLGESWENKEVMATGDVHLRDSPPKGLFCTKGNEIDVVKSGEKVKVLKYIKISCSLVFSDDFLKIERLGPGIPESRRYGYVAVFDKETHKALFTAGR
jgi:hypothetical protein